MRISRLDVAAIQERMVVALHDDQCISFAILAGDEPRCGVAVAHATDAQALALAKRVIREPRMRSDGPAFRRDDRPRIARQIPREEIAKRPLADEADAGGILLVPRRNP